MKAFKEGMNVRILQSPHEKLESRKMAELMSKLFLMNYSSSSVTSTLMLKNLEPNSSS